MGNNHWQYYFLGDLTDNFDSIRVPVKEADRRKGPFSYYGASGIIDMVDKYIFDGEYLLIAEDGENLRSRKTPIAFMASGKFWVNNHAHIVRGSERADTRFLMYYLHQSDISGFLTGSTLPKLTQDNLNRIPIFTPPLPEQRAIAGILGALDDKIELNRRMNVTLESIARAVVRQWFLENEEAESWKVGKLGDVAENIRRGANPEDIETDTPYIGLEHMPRGSIALSDWSNANEVVSNKFFFRQGEFLFGKLRPYFHKVGIAPLDGVCSTDILVIVPKSPEWYGFVLGHISSVELINYTNAASTGTKMPRTNWSDIARYEVAIPPVKIAKEFNEMFLPMAQQIRANIMQSRTLARLRDALLPKLMRGEVRVKDIATQ